MKKNKNLEDKIICGLNPNDNSPKHALPISTENQKSNFQISNCYDSRKSECSYYVSAKNKDYCNYSSSK